MSITIITKLAMNLLAKLKKNNRHSDNAIAVMKNEKLVGHVPGALAKKPSPLMKEWEV